MATALRSVLTAQARSSAVSPRFRVRVYPRIRMAGRAACRSSSFAARRGRGSGSHSEGATRATLNPNIGGVAYQLCGPYRRRHAAGDGPWVCERACFDYTPLIYELHPDHVLLQDSAGAGLRPDSGHLSKDAMAGAINNATPPITLANQKLRRSVADSPDTGWLHADVIV